MSQAYSNAFGGMFGMPVTTGTVTHKKPSSLKHASAHKCVDCGMVWESSPYNPADDPIEHRLFCVDGWSPEYVTWTITYWKGYVVIPEPEEAE